MFRISVLIPKFAIELAARVCELRVRGTGLALIFVVWTGSNQDGLGLRFL